MNNSKTVKRRAAFVTGGAGAIGSAICRKLAECGFNIAVGYNKSNAAADKLCDELIACGITAVAVKCDVTDYDSICAAKTSACKVLGNIDTVVNNAGLAAYRLFGDETAKTIYDTVNADLVGTMLVCRAFSPDMVSNRFGRIVNISSVWGICGAAMETVYSAAKAGVIGFTKALAEELAPSLVTVNAVSPGFIDTPMNARFSESELALIADDIPACRFGTPADVAAAVSFLASKEAEYITGQNIAVAGRYKGV